MKDLGRLRLTLVAVALLIAQLSCGDSSGPPGLVATSIAANSPTSQNAAPGAAVAVPPSVIVKDQNGAPLAGINVTFVVTSGGGAVTGANATTSSTGIATVGSWTLGTGAGANTLTASAGGLPAVIFTANGADPCDVLVNYSLGSTTNGELTTSDCAFSDGSLI